MSRTWLTFTLTVLGGAAVPGGPHMLAAQSYLERTPHVDGGWVGIPGMLYMDDWALFRRTAQEGDGWLATPVYRALLSLPRRFLIGGTLAANARADGRDVLELFARAGLPASLEENDWGFGFTAGYSRPDGSVDGEISLWKALGRLRFLTAARGYSNLDGRGGRAGFIAGGVMPLSPGRIAAALAADVGHVVGDGSKIDPLWSIGLHAGIAATPFTVAFQASNGRDPGFQGSMVEVGEIHFGVSVMSPIPVGRVLGWFAPRTQSARSVNAAGSDPDMMRVRISGHAYWPQRIEIAAGKTVEWVNQDHARHTITALDATFHSGDLNQADRWRARFDQAGTYVYQCGLHPFMQAIVRVR